MNLFLVDGMRTYGYELLLRRIQEKRSYIKAYQTEDLFSFFENMLFAWVNDQPITLIDSDLTSHEMNEIDPDDCCEKAICSPKEIISLAQLIEEVLHSSSEVALFTSGTTGQPKKVIHSLLHLTRNVRLSDAHQKAIWGFTYNPTHMAGLQLFLQAFANANQIVNLFHRSRSDVYQAIGEYQISHLSATPTFYRLLLPVEESYSCVTRTSFGGERSDAMLYQKIQEIFPVAKINNIYASTEAGTLFAAHGEYFKIPSSIAHLIQVKDEEILIHCSLLGQSSSFQLKNDYYHSGDLIEWIDETEQLFRFKSRKNELINVGGYKVNPAEVEEMINEMEGVFQCMVFGKANSVLGNILCAEVQLEKGSLVTELEIRKWISGNMQDFKVPRRIKFVESFAQTRTGKIKRK